MIFQEKVKKTMKRSDFSEMKSKNREEKAQLIKILSRNLNTFWLKK